MSELKPTDIPKEWLAWQYRNRSVGNIVNKISKGDAPIPDHLTDSVSRTVVSRAMCIYGLFPNSEIYKQENWLRSLYEDNKAVESGQATIDDLVVITQEEETIDGISSETIIRWLDVYNVPTDKRSRDEIPRSKEFDRDFFVQKHHKEGLNLAELTQVVNDRTDDEIEITRNTIRDYIDWLCIDLREPGNSQKELDPIENIDQYILDHHYRVRNVKEVADADINDSIRFRQRWLEENDEVNHWVGQRLLPDSDILYEKAGTDKGATPEIAKMYDEYRDKDNPVKKLAGKLDLPAAAVELALVFYGIRDELTFVTIDDESVIEGVPRGQSELLTTPCVFAVLRLTFDMDHDEIADYLDVCEGLVKFASRLYDIPVETAVGRPSEGYRGQLHDPRYLRQQISRMSVSELAASHNYESDTTVKRLLDAFEIDPPNKIQIPELGCSVRSNPEKHVAKLLAQLNDEHPEIKVGYEVTRIPIDLSEFDCRKTTKQYVPDFTIDVGDKTLYVEVKGRVDNGALHDHIITDRQKAKASMDTLADDETEQYVVITNGAELEWYDFTFSFVEHFEPKASFECYDQIIENMEEFISLLTSSPAEFSA